MEFVQSGRLESLIGEKLALASAFTRQAQRQLRNGMRDRAGTSARTARAALQEAWDVVAVVPEGRHAMRDRITASDRELRRLEVELIGDIHC